MEGAARLSRIRHEVHDAGARVNDRRIRDTDFRTEFVAAHVTRHDNVDAVGRIDKAVFPEDAVAVRSGGGVVGIEGINAIVFRCDKNDVVHAAIGQGDV